MDANTQKGLLDRVYERRKAATLELEKQVREASLRGDRERIRQIVNQLCGLVSTPSASPHAQNARNGGLIGLAGISIALGVETASHLEQVVPPVLACFSDPDAKIRYFACESFYNISKVSKGEILVYFNETFDALSKLAADSELSVKNGAELLDRLLKDIVCEAAPHYVSQYQDLARIRSRQDADAGNIGGAAELDVAREKAAALGEPGTSRESNAHDAGDHGRAFSLARFVPLLSERMYVVSPFTRNYLVGWITVLRSIPNLELVSFLPHFLDGLMKYLSDPNLDVRVATANVLEDFLRECKESASHQPRHLHRSPEIPSRDKASPSGKTIVDLAPEREDAHVYEEQNDGDDGGWIPAKAVRIDFTAIVEILLRHISDADEEIQATAQLWISELILVVPEVVIPFTPRLIPVILPSLAHHSPAITSAAQATNLNLYTVIQHLPDPIAGPWRCKADTVSAAPKASSESESRNRGAWDGEKSIFDLQRTVSELTVQLIDEHEETRVTALRWLLMLHRKAPNDILSMEDGTFPALLKTLSDPSEEVIRHDLRLLAQISSTGGERDDAYLRSFMGNLMNLFSTDRRLLELRGNLVIRQLCASLDTDRIFRLLAEILEKDEDLEFASVMVLNLNMILMTSPELADFRRRLRGLDTRDGQQLFVILYRSWCHNAVAAFSLCLLAQAYEHASNLLHIFAELDITVSLLVQIDKLVQLLESPVFTSLRLQLLEPDRYPHLFKCLYGLLMLLPQSSAFATLRNRLNAVSSLGFLHVVPRVGTSSTTAGAQTSALSAGAKSKVAGNVAAKDDIKWVDLLSHFRRMQHKHEAMRMSTPAQPDDESSVLSGQARAGSRLHVGPTAAPVRRKGSGMASSSQVSRNGPGALSGGRVAGSANVDGPTSSFFALNLSSSGGVSSTGGATPSPGGALSPRKTSNARSPNATTRRT